LRRQLDVRVKTQLARRCYPAKSCGRRIVKLFAGRGRFGKHAIKNCARELLLVAGVFDNHVICDLKRPHVEGVPQTKL